MSTQADISYGDDAQRRVAADTLCYQKKATLAMPTSGTATLPTDLIRIEGLYNGDTPLCRASKDALLGFLSAGIAADGLTFAIVVGRTLYVYPLPSAALTLTLVYRARPPAWDSESALTLTGPFETLTDQLVQAMTLLDSGQTNVAADRFQAYEAGAANLRRRANGKTGSSGRVRTVRGVA